MKSILFKFNVIVVAIMAMLSTTKKEITLEQIQEFQGKAFYISKSTMDLGRWGARFSEAQKKQIMARMKNRLEKTYTLTFNKEESFFKEDEKLDAMSGATDSWGKNFAQGDQYKNVKENQLVQSQEFYGKRFLVKDSLQTIDWKLGTETKTIGNYTCFRASANVDSDELSWYSFSWDKLRKKTDTINAEAKMTIIEAWYTPQIPVQHGPSEYWGLPGLILEVSAGNTTMLCSKIVMSTKEFDGIAVPDKGKEITKAEYQSTIMEKMQEFRNNRGRRRGR